MAYFAADSLTRSGPQEIAYTLREGWCFFCLQPPFELAICDLRTDEEGFPCWVTAEKNKRGAVQSAGVRGEQPTTNRDTGSSWLPAILLVLAEDADDAALDANVGRGDHDRRHLGI